MAASTANKTRLKSCLAKMDKKYGVTKVIGGGASLEQCLFLIIREGWDFKKASKTVRTLEAAFIDWNEARVSTVGELIEKLHPLICADLRERMLRVKEFLNAVMNEFCVVDNDMFKPMEYESLRRFMMGTPSLGKANACIVLQCFMSEQDKKGLSEKEKEKFFVISPESMRVGIRLGIIKKTQSINAARAEFLKMVRPAESLRFQNLMVRHGEKICFSKNPNCAECFLSDGCDFFKSR